MRILERGISPGVHPEAGVLSKEAKKGPFPSQLNVGILVDSRMGESPEKAKPGGVQTIALTLKKALEGKGHKADIITCGAVPEEIEGKEIISTGIALETDFLEGRTSTLLALVGEDEIWRILEKGKYDVLQFQAPFANFSLKALGVSSSFNTVNVATCHVYHEKWESPILGPFAFVSRGISRWRLLDKIHAWIADSEPAARICQRLYGLKKCEIIPPGIDLERFSRKVPAMKEYCDGKINILYLGRLDPRKGVKELWEAFNMLRIDPSIAPIFANLRLIIAGTGGLERKGRKFVKKNCLEENVVFLGYVTEEEKLRLLATATFCCAPAKGGESFGIWPLEVIAAGKAIVAGDNIGYRGILGKEPFRDFLVKPGNVGALAEALRYLILSPDLRRRLGEAGRQEAEENYSDERYVEDVLGVYQRAWEKRWG